ncbi:hypothetical protein DFH09DRAFT_1080712 [Mycena vulgaris]|nr:hypothetical protein DFH09DRAFT_1080706 [Mycena vulgaris]KAJ6568335.1 hypothetical protein DFH09DRAFT_1080712 [Mycena vulgaris]
MCSTQALRSTPRVRSTMKAAPPTPTMPPPKVAPRPPIPPTQAPRSSPRVQSTVKAAPPIPTMPPPEILPRPLISPSAGGRSIWVIRKRREDLATLPPGHVSPLESVHPAVAFSQMGAGASRPPTEVFWGIANDHHIFESRLDAVNRIFDQRMGQADLYSTTNIRKLSTFVTGRKYKRKPQDPPPTNDEADDEADAQDA